jgi:hypothetical protein
MTYVPHARPPVLSDISDVDLIGNFILSEFPIPEEPSEAMEKKIARFWRMSCKRPSYWWGDLQTLIFPALGNVGLANLVLQYFGPKMVIVWGNRGKVTTFATPVGTKNLLVRGNPNERHDVMFPRLPSRPIYGKDAPATVAKGVIALLKSTNREKTNAAVLGFIRNNPVKKRKSKKRGRPFPQSLDSRMQASVGAYTQGLTAGIASGVKRGKKEQKEFMKDNDVQDAFNFGLGKGKTAEYPLAFCSGYDEGYDVGRERGFKKGKTTEYPLAFSSGYEEGYDAGSKRGFKKGQTAEYPLAFCSGYGEGYDAGYDSGSESGFDAGVDRGEATGNVNGFTNGFEAALALMHDAISNGDPVSSNVPLSAVGNAHLAFLQGFLYRRD